MAEYIKREDVFEAYSDWLSTYDIGFDCAHNLLVKLDELPVETVVEKKKGEWLYWLDEPDYDTYECSACGTSFNIPDGNPFEHNYNFCPNCGAEMSQTLMSGTKEET